MESDSSRKQNRRAWLAAGAAAIPALALGARARRSEAADADIPQIAPCRLVGPSAHFFPNVAVTTQHGKKLRFYDDLIYGKIVLINFMSIRGDDQYPVIENLVKVQRLLGDRVGRDMHMISISIDPDHDTPEKLHDFTEKHGVGDGWSFLHAAAESVNMIRSHLFVQRNTPAGPTRVKANFGFCCSLGLLRYGNEALGRWGSVPARITPESIAKRFEWLGMRRVNS